MMIRRLYCPAEASCAPPYGSQPKTHFSDAASSASRSVPVARWLRITVTLAVLLGIFFRFYHLDRKVFWEDEILGAVHMLGYTEAEIVEASPHLKDASAVQHFLHASAPIGHLALTDTVRSLAIEDPQHPPVYYLATRLWVSLFGSSPAAIRSLSAVP
jgi:uncharacterized membrane protein